jgi:Tfp pilus assembly protein PilV
MGKIMRDGGPDRAGFTVIEILFALLIMTLGLLAAGQMIFVAMSSASLARSKSNAALLAQDKLEILADLYRRDPEASELSVGNHGPDQVQVQVHGGGSTPDRYSVSWVVSVVADPREGARPVARSIRVNVAPSDTGGVDNQKSRLNKRVSVNCVLTSGIR